MESAFLGTETPPPLQTLLRAEQLTEICAEFQRLHGISARVENTDGALLAETNARDGSDESHVHAPPDIEIGTEPAWTRCRCNARFLNVGIFNDLDRVGHLRVGPVPEKQADTMMRETNLLGFMLSSLVYASYQAFLVGQVHVSSMRAAFADLQVKNEALQRSYERLQELDKLKDNFIATVSHELRTPITSIIGYAEMIREGMLGRVPKKAREKSGVIVERADELLMLVNNLLDLSRIQNGHMEITPRPTNLRELIASALESVTPQAQSKKIKLKTTVKADTREVSIDPEKCRRVIINLVANAIKFTPTGGRVRIEAGPHATDPALFQLTIIDTGAGIPIDALPRIFDPFFQVDNSSTRNAGGTGLGLSIVRSMVELQRGTIAVSSTLGTGTTMTVTLPRAVTRITQ